jgi:uncharacterized protein (TIGR03435 family)
MQLPTTPPARVRRWRVGLCSFTASLAVLSVAPSFLRAQDANSSGPQTSALRFEVASIRPADPQIHQGSFWRTTPAGDIRVHSVPLLALIMSAYGLRDFQVVGYPGWVASDSFDVEAKSGEESTVNPENASRNARLQARLRSLLIERCQLTARPGTQTQMAWVLTVDRSGSKMYPAEPNPASAIFRPFALSAGAMTMTEFSAALSNIIHGVVVDQTELQGAYKIDLHWSRSTEPNETPGASASLDASQVPDALREQLGLVLTRRKAAVDILIVERIQRPSAN